MLINMVLYVFVDYILSGDVTISLGSRSMSTIYIFYVDVNAYTLMHARSPPSYSPKYQMRVTCVPRRPACLHPQL